MKFQTLNEVIVDLVVKCPARGIGYIEPGGGIRFHTFKEIFDQALRILGGLRGKNLEQGNYVLVVLDKNEEIIPVLWACFLGGFIPSLLQAPMSYSSGNLQVKKIENIWELMKKPPVIISAKACESWKNAEKNFNFLSFDELAADEPDSNISSTSPVDVVYIQFSSGSTGDPKGVLLTNRNILSNVHDIATTNRFNSQDVSLNWMPLFHDMGLVGFHLTPIYVQSTHYFIDTISFIKNPILWLDAITNLRVDVTAAPNFGQALTLRHLARKKNDQWDFSSVRSFFNGAEPISADIMQRFISEMAKYGFRNDAMLPCYGMAEATLAISMRKKVVSPTIKPFDRKTLYNNRVAVEVGPDADALNLVGVGVAMGRNQIRIVDEKGLELTESNVGHIRIKGANITNGFFNPEADEDDFFKDGWLLTGDMGFFYQGELFITGRAKDLIIINGQNYYAHDLEQVVVSFKPEFYGKIACVSFFDHDIGREKVIVFIVGPSDPKHFDQYRNVSRLFNEKLGIQLDEIIPVSTAEMHRTSSGKLQRYKLVNDYKNGVFQGHSKIIKPSASAQKGLPDVHTTPKI